MKRAARGILALAISATLVLAGIQAAGMVVCAMNGVLVRDCACPHGDAERANALTREPCCNTYTTPTAPDMASADVRVPIAPPDSVAVVLPASPASSTPSLPSARPSVRGPPGGYDLLLHIQSFLI